MRLFIIFKGLATKRPTTWMCWTTGKVTGTACLDLRVWQEIYSTFHWAQSPLIEAIQLRNPSSLRAQLYSITTEQQRSYTARRITSGLNQCCVPLGWTRKSLSCKALVINNHFINLLTFLSKWFYIILLLLLNYYSIQWARSFIWNIYV